MSNVYFADERVGYNKEQVDSYIKKLTQAYQTAFDEHQSICNKYDELLKNYKKLEARRHLTIEAGIAAKLLTNAEVLAQSIIDDAKAEAKRIVAGTD